MLAHINLAAMSVVWCIQKKGLIVFGTVNVKMDVMNTLTHFKYTHRERERGKGSETYGEIMNSGCIAVIFGTCSCSLDFQVRKVNGN